MPTFADVKAILDTIKTNHPNWGDVQIVHSANGSNMNNPLDWQTKEQLQKVVIWRFEGVPKASVAYPLIDLSGGKKAADTYIIKALSGPFAKQIDSGSYPRMPFGGPFLSASDIKTIADWIDSGMPD